MHSSWTLALSCSVLFLNMQNFAPVSGLALDRMHHLVFHILPKIVGLQTDSRQPPAHIHNKVHINRKDNAGMQSKQTKHNCIN